MITIKYRCGCSIEESGAVAVVRNVACCHLHSHVLSSDKTKDEMARDLRSILNQEEVAAEKAPEVPVAEKIYETGLLGDAHRNADGASKGLREVQSRWAITTEYVANMEPHLLEVATLDRQAQTDYNELNRLEHEISNLNMQLHNKLYALREVLRSPVKEGSTNA